MSDEIAECRGCRRELNGKPFHKGGSAYVPGTETRNRPSGIRALAHYYGGWVCSASCNRHVFRQMDSQNVWSSEDARRMRDGDDYFANA